MTNYQLKDLESETTDMKNRDEATEGKRKRHLEILSLICTTVGINIAIACLCGLPSSFGPASPDLFLKCAFAFLLASVLLGILAMISGIKGYEFLQTLFLPMPKQSSLFSLLNAIHFRRRRNFEASENAVTKMAKRQLPVSGITEIIENIKVTPKCLDDSARRRLKCLSENPDNFGYPQGCSSETTHSLKNPSIDSAVPDTQNKCLKETNKISGSASSGAVGNPFLFTASVANKKRQRSPIYNGNSLLFRECGVSTRTQGQRFSSPSPRNIKQLKAKNVLQLKKRRNTILFGQLFAADSSGSVRGPITFSCEVDGNKKYESLHPFFHENFENKLGATEEQFPYQSHPSETPTSDILTRSVSYCKSNSHFQEGYNSQERLLPFIGNYEVHEKDKVSDVVLKLNEMNFLS